MINVKKAHKKRMQALEAVNAAKVHVSMGNSKMGAIPSFSVLPLVTCINCGECSKCCYACKSTFNFPSTINSEAENTFLVMNDPRRVENELNAFLGGINLYRYFRWNVAGDVFSKEYLDIIVNVARANELTTFLVFTKNFDLFNEYLRENELPNNLRVVFSKWDNAEINNEHGLPEAIVKINENTVIPENAYECSGRCDQCLECWHAKNGTARYFNLH